MVLKSTKKYLIAFLIRNYTLICRKEFENIDFAKDS
jgi:hypothetical protein